LPKGSLTVADLRFDISGNINYSASTLNLAIDGRKISIASVISRLPEKWKNSPVPFPRPGSLILSAVSQGLTAKQVNLTLSLTYGLTNGKMSHSATGFKVNNLEFRGEISNGDHNSAETFRFTVDNLTARYGSASVKGSFMLNNLRRPHITLALSGDLDFDDLTGSSGRVT
jgi:hypothetical protein